MEPTREVQKECVVRPGVPHQPLHGIDDVFPGRLHDGVLLVVGQNDHVLAAVAVALDQEGRDVADVVDAAAQLAVLAEIVDADQQGAATAGAVGVLERVLPGRAVAELLQARGRGRGSRRLGAGTAMFRARPARDWVAIHVIALGRRSLGRRVAPLLLLRVAVVVPRAGAVALAGIRGHVEDGTARRGDGKSCGKRWSTATRESALRRATEATVTMCEQEGGGDGDAAAGREMTREGTSRLGPVIAPVVAR